MTLSETPKPDPAADERERRKRAGSQSAAAARIGNQSSWVDQQIRVAMAKGEFDDLPGTGKPIRDLGGQHDPDWWLKKLVEREQITVVPMSLQLRQQDAELDDRLDRLNSDDKVRKVVEEFNAQVIAARYRAPEGPPLVTMPRDVDEEVAAWRTRRTTRHAEAARRAEEAEAARRAAPARRRWWRRDRSYR